MPAMIAISAKPESDDDGPTFDLPKGVDFTDVQEGDEKEVTAVLRKEADGKVCIVKVNGVPLKQDEQETPDDEEAEGPADNEAMASPSPTMGSAAQSAGLM